LEEFKRRGSSEGFGEIIDRRERGLEYVPSSSEKGNGGDRVGISKAPGEERIIDEVRFWVSIQMPGEDLYCRLGRGVGPLELGPVGIGAQSVSVKRLSASLSPPRDAEIEVQ
jgi:hypothetical protein